MKKFVRREFLLVAGLAAAGSTLSHPAFAQAYPARPVRLVVPFNAGGSTDLVGRIICQWLTERLGQSFVVENKPGGGTNIGTQLVANSPADGYTLLYTVSTHAINPSLYKSLPFDFQRDIVAVGGLFEFPLVLVMSPQVPAKSVAEFIAYAKANPGKVNIASFGVRTISHLSIELLKTSTGIEFVHVPYTGGAPMLTDLISGRIQAGVDALPNSLPHIRSGSVRALAILSRDADGSRFPTCRPWTRPSRASRPPHGTASARRRARRPRSSRASTARSTRACKTRHCSSVWPMSAARRSVRRPRRWPRSSPRTRTSGPRW